MVVSGTLATIPRAHSLGVHAGLLRKGRGWKRFKSGPRSWAGRRMPITSALGRQRSEAEEFKSSLNYTRYIFFLKKEAVWEKIS